MRAVVLRQGQLVVAHLADPEPGDGQVLVRTLACGICGSDLHAVRHLDELARTLRAAEQPFPIDPTRDMVLGHEFCVEVVDYGPHTQRKIKPGARVCSMPVLAVEGRLHPLSYSNTHVGAYGEMLLLSEDFLLPVPEGLPTRSAALTEPLAVGLHAVARARLAKGDVPLVIGCGPVGLLIVASLRSQGVEPIIAADFAAVRRRQAEALGAHVVVDPKEQSASDVWRRHARGKKRAVIFECVGVPGMLDQVMRSAPANARIIVAGVCLQEDRLRPALGILKELEMQFVFGYTGAEFAQALRTLAEGQVCVESLITGCVGLEGVAGAFADLANPEQHVKILVEPGR